MEREADRLNYWRKYFSGCNSDIFAVIENAILVAASDCPKEFLSRRDSIAEKLFSCRSRRCVGCDHVELRVPCGVDDDQEELERRDFVRPKIGGEEDGDHAGGSRMLSNYSYDEAEALTEEIEEEGQAVSEVLRIKELFTNNEYKFDSILFESLRRLQLMGLSVETLKVTEIGKIVNGLKRHSSNQIRQLARTLIDGWKAMVEEWANSTVVLSEATPESANPPPPTLDEWDGLPLPPLDVGALFATQTGTMELSQFFEGMDDDGNLRSSGEYNDYAGTRKTSSMENGDNHARKLQSCVHRDSDDKIPTRMTETPDNKLNRPKFQNMQDRSQFRGPSHGVENQFKKSNGQRAGSGLEAARSLRPSNDQRVSRDAMIQNRPPEVQQKPLTVSNNKECAEDHTVREKLEIAKRKLHEGYRQAETAKRQRTIQVMELHDLPKQVLDNRQLHQKPVNGNRYRMSRRV